MARVYVSVGSNVERERNIRSCIHSLRERFGSLMVSSIYHNKAVGFEGDAFLNLVVDFDTSDPVRAVAAHLRDIEVAHGRLRDAPKFSPRTLDLDLLLYDDLVLEASGLLVPRDEITRYAFVLCPLAEVAGEQRHPILGVTFVELWEAFDKTREHLRPVPFEF